MIETTTTTDTSGLAAREPLGGDPPGEPARDVGLTWPPVIPEPDPGTALSWNEFFENRHARRQAKPDAEAAPSEPVGSLNDAARRRAAAYVESAVAGVVAELRKSASWPKDRRDEHGRGWEKVQADAARWLGRVARADWNDFTLAEAERAFVAAAPTGGGWTARDVARKWAYQSVRSPAADVPSGVRDAAEGRSPGRYDPADLLVDHGSDEPVDRAVDAATDQAVDHESDQDEGRRRLVLTSAAFIKPRRVRWLWDGRLALGTLGLLAGREGLGKSSLAYWVVAQITRGVLAGEFLGQPRAVLVCATEDSWTHTIVPRLIAVGADLTKVFQVEVVTDGITVGLSLPRDLLEMEAAATSTGASLLLLDPLMSRLSETLDSHKDGEVRRALEPLVAIADRTDMAVLGLIHHNKSGSADPLQLVMGSKAFTAVARSVHTVIADPDDETDTRRLFGTPKNNLGATDLPTLAFTMAGHPVETDDGTAWTGKVVWGETSTATIGEAMRRSTETQEDRSATTEASEWLDDYLSDNEGEAASADIKRDGAKAGHSQDALKRAKTRLRLGVHSTGFPRRTFWSFTPESRSSAQSEHQSAPIPRGGPITALTAPTGGKDAQSVQSVQLEQSVRPLGRRAPTAAPTAPDHAPGVKCSTCRAPLATAFQRDQGRCNGCVVRERAAANRAMQP